MKYNFIRLLDMSFGVDLTGNGPRSDSNHDVHQMCLKLLTPSGFCFYLSPAFLGLISKILIS